MVSSVHNWTGPSILDVFQLSNSEEDFFSLILISDKQILGPYHLLWTDPYNFE